MQELSFTPSELQSMKIELMPPKKWLDRLTCVIKGELDIMVKDQYVLSTTIDALQESYEVFEGEYDADQSCSISTWIVTDHNGTEYTLSPATIEQLDNMSYEIVQNIFATH